MCLVRLAETPYAVALLNYLVLSGILLSFAIAENQCSCSFRLKIVLPPPLLTFADCEPSE